ncbi:TonB-dependent receptor [Granulicella sp. dw_53]|uniref:TonB-dependent receptor n=1 Tax=Granulicella sp. dw_53 TaxID=2719792 RepID=UPI001BD61A66|nr:TonB-dependent receptor [Granulicella sp. dw_53]
MSVALCVLSPSAFAQLSTATLFGTVTDPAGAAVPDAKVTIIQTDTGFVRAVVTNENGSYRADFLPIGPYKVTVESRGFKKLERTGITLNVTEEAHLDVALTLGMNEQTIEVTAEIPLLNTGNSTLGRTVDNAEIDNLPLVDRNVYALLDLTPGIQNNNNAGTGGNGGVINPLGYPEQHVKINGSTDSSVGQISYYLDGGSNMTGIRNTGNPLPNPDAIREFAVQTNNFSAQFGRSSGGVVTVLTKSGTNQFHGSVFEFYRTRNFNATQHLFAQKTPYNQHRFGFTVGGPIKHDKLFFFGSYAGFRFVSANALTTTVPSAAMNSGNFSENLPTTGLTGAAACAATATATKFYVCDPNTRLPYAGNIVPASAFDPAIANIVKAGLIPTPNPSQPGDTAYSRRDLQRFTQATNEQLYKADYQITGMQRLTLSYFHQTGDYVLNPSGNNVLNWTTHNYNFLQHNANIQHVWTLSNSTVNQLYAGYTRLLGGRVASPGSLATFGSKFQEQLPDGSICGAAAQAGCSMPQFSVSGWFTAGNAITGPVTGNNLYLIRDVVSSTHGKHTVFFGGEANLEKDAQQTFLNNYGTFSFSQANNTKGRTSAAITDFYFGRPATMGQDVPVYANANYWNFGLFLQDDWRILPRLTLNLGVRYDVQTAPVDVQRRTLNFQPGVQSTMVPTAPLGVLFVGDAGVPAGGAKTQYDHISPRFGLSWSPYANSRTVLHAGGGIFFGSVAGNLFEYPSNGLPFSGRPSFRKVISVADPYTGDPSEFCPNPAGGCIVGVSPYPYVYSSSNVKFFVRPSPIIALDPNFHWPEIYQFNLGFQQQLTNSFALSATYVGSLSRKIPIFNDVNYPVYTPGAPTATPAAGTAASASGKNYPNTSATVDNRRPFNQTAALGGTGAGATGGLAGNPTYQSVNVIQSSEGANYHGLQVSAEQRVTHNFSVKGFYVWSKSLQSEPLDSTGNTGNSAATAPQDPNLKYLDKQRSDFDQRHLSTIAFVYKPNYSVQSFVMRNLVNGWTVTSIIRLQSGQPFNLTTGTDVNGDGNNNDRPNLSGLATPAINDHHGSRVAAMNSWVSATAFCTFSPATGACPGVGPGGSDGTYSANSLNSPGRRSVDASLFREFNLVERMRFQLRGEATNVFNLTNLPAPITTLSSPNFGHITGTIQGGSFSNRVLQVGGRILF